MSNGLSEILNIFNHAKDNFGVAKNFSSDTNSTVISALSSAENMASAAGKSNPLASGGVATLGLTNDLRKIREDLKNNRPIKDADILSALSNASALAATAHTMEKDYHLALLAGMASLILGGVSLIMPKDSHIANDVYKSAFNIYEEVNNYLGNKFDDIINYLTQPQTGFFTISNPTAYETDGKITFTINLKQPLKEDVKLRLKTMDQTAKADLDFEGIDSYITIPAGETTYEYTVKIASDGIYEGSEKFNLYIADINYNGDDEVILNYSPGYGTILDFPQQECPKPQIPNFGFSFHTPTTKHISGGDNSYSGGGGGWGSSSIAYTPTTPSKKSLPYIPEYECYYDPELNSVLKVKLPSNLNTKNGNQTNNELNFTSSNNSNNTSTLRNFSKNLSTSTINSLNLINSKDLKQTDLNTTQTIKSSNNLDDNNQLSTLNLKESNTPSNNPNPKQTKLYFDMNSDGFKERMLNWLNDDEAILINDINNNGLVDSGLEIIGNNYNNTSSPDSFTLLKKFDTNKDGIIDSKDSHNLALWIDSEKAA